MAKRAAKAKTPEAAKRAARTVTLGAENGKKAGRVQMVPMDQIRIDGGTQVRVELDHSTLVEYARLMSEGVEFPAVDVYFDGSEYWLADGFHRYHATRRANNDEVGSLVRTFTNPTHQTEIAANVFTGTQRDAVLHAVQANHAHGKRRSNADKRRAVEILLMDETWKSWSDRIVAKEAGVSHPFVADVRRELETVTSCEQPETTIGADGKARKRPKADRSQDQTDPVEPVDLPSPNPSTIANGTGDRPSPNPSTMANGTGDRPSRDPATPDPPPVAADYLDSPPIYRARRAIALLDEIHADDPLRYAALRLVAEWIEDHV